MHAAAVRTHPTAAGPHYHDSNIFSSHKTDSARNTRRGRLHYDVRLLGLWTYSLALLMSTASNAVQLDYLASLVECKTSPNPHTQTPAFPQHPPEHFPKSRRPLIQANHRRSLRYWAENRYLVVSRVVTEGLHQESLRCEANICVKKGDGNRHESNKDCTADSGFEETGGLCCVTARVVVSILPKSVEQVRWAVVCIHRYPRIP